MTHTRPAPWGATLRRRGRTGPGAAALAALLAGALALPLAGAPAATAQEAAPVATAARTADARLLVSVGDAAEVPAARRALRAVGRTVRLAPRVLVVDGERAAVAAAVADLDATVEANALLHAAQDAEPDTAPDDPRFPDQWGLRNTGQTVPVPEEWPDSGEQMVAGEPGVDVDALGAWEHADGAGTTVAVVDTEVSAHRDLDANLAPGRSFAMDDPFCAHDHSPHGTQVAGVVAARADNGRGVAGLAPRATVLPVAFMNPCNVGSLATAVQAIAWAAEQGADVIVASFNSEGDLNPEDIAALRRAIEDAAVPVIAAAGNTGRDLSAKDAEPTYPAAFDVRNQLTVTSVGPDGRRPARANYGRDHVQLAAPGVAIPTTSIERETGHEAYAAESGTSFAVPHVAGALALAESLDPVLTPLAVLDLVEATVREREELAGEVTTGGMLDAGALVHAVAEEGSCPTTEPAVSDFVDVDDDGSHARAVDCLVRWEVSKGRSPRTYAPREPVTRGQSAGFLAAVVDLGIQLPEDPPVAFTDTAGTEHAEAIHALAELGLVDGYDDERFRPNEPISRPQMASLLVAVHAQLQGPVPSVDEPWFTDVGATHGPAADALWELGVAAGTAPRTFGADIAVRRDQMASFVARMLDRLVREGALEAR